MRLRHLFFVILTLFLCTASAFAFLDFKMGYTKTLGELGDRYGGGLFINLGLKLPLPGPLYIVPNGTYASLGSDANFVRAMDEYIDGQFPGGVPFDIDQYGEVESSLYTIGAGVRFQALDHFMLGIHFEPGFMYVRRELSAVGIPLSLLKDHIPGFDLPVEPDNGYGFYLEGGGALLNKFPIISIKFGVRYMMAFNVGTTSIDRFMERNIPNYDAPTAKHLSMLAIYGGFGLF
jgi:hypothetical protein